jgi:DNA-directed RNA polymerase subunit M/transcription elongation factor TFIIS
MDLDRRTAERRHVDVAVPTELDRRARHQTSSGRRATDAIKMACPFCGSSESAVVRSRGAINEDVIRRRRECVGCGKRFPTIEAVDMATLARELASDERQRLAFHAIVMPASNN